MTTTTDELLRKPMNPPGAGSGPAIGIPTRGEIEGWNDAINELSCAAESYRRAADRVEGVADTHARQMSAPGGSMWAGDGADSAFQAVYADRGVVYRAADHMRDVAKTAGLAAQDLSRIRDRALDAISEAEADGYRVGDDLTVSDRRSYLSGSSLYEVRKVKADEHHRYISMWANALASEDVDVGSKLQAGANALIGLVPAHWKNFDEAEAGAVELVDFRSQPEAPPFQPTDVRNAEDVHRIVDPLPPGRQPWVKTLPTAPAIEALYGQLTENSVPGPPSTYRGQWRVLQDGTKIGLRNESKFGGPTVEIWYPDGGRTDVHLAERPSPRNPAPVTEPAPVRVPDAPPSAVPVGPSNSFDSPPIFTPEESGVLGVIGGIAVGIAAGMVELGKFVVDP